MFPEIVKNEHYADVNAVWKVETVILGSSALAEVFLPLGANRPVLSHRTIFSKFKEYLTIVSLIASKHRLACFSPPVGLGKQMEDIF